MSLKREPAQHARHNVFTGFALVGTLSVLFATVAADPASAVAAEFTVSNGDVAGLISAINRANSNGEGDTIHLASGGTYTVSAVDNTGANGPNGLPLILNDSGTAPAIEGHGSVIERGSAAPNMRLLEVAFGATLELDAVIVRDGRLVGIVRSADGADGGAAFGGAVWAER